MVAGGAVVALTAAWVGFMAPLSARAHSRAHGISMREAGEPGTAVNPDAISWEDRKWSKRSDTSLTDDGACFIVQVRYGDRTPPAAISPTSSSCCCRRAFPMWQEDEAPDPSKQWFFCSDPSDDENMVCELVPEWMGEAPDGGHAVWMCSAPKPAE